MEFCYRNLTASEENRFDRYFVEKVCAIFSPRLSLRHTPTIYLIAPDPFGEHRFDFSIAGCCPPDGRSIHILRDLALRDLINVTLHELRHAFQKQQNRHNHNSQMRERDARIFELEINCPHGEAKIFRWLAEEECNLNHRNAAAPEYLPARKLDYAPNGLRKTVYRPTLLETNTQERVAFIETLLALLPNSVTSNNQRATLVEELTRLK